MAVATTFPIFSSPDVHNFYVKQKQEFHFNQKSDNDFLMFLLDTAVRVISIGKYFKWGWGMYFSCFQCGTYENFSIFGKMNTQRLVCPRAIKSTGYFPKFGSKDSRPPHPHEKVSLF